jgi:hypothetical protein
MSNSTPFLGIVMLDTSFPRPLGDIGQAATWTRAGIAVRYLRVPGATAERVVVQADAALAQPFVQAMQTLADQGAGMISTSCGFLAAHQRLFEQCLDRPVISSSLLQCAGLRRPGILTFDASALTPAVLQGAGVAMDTPVEGLVPGCHLHRVILHNEAELDLAAAQGDVVQAAVRLVQRHPQIEHIVFECTNLPPYREAVEAATWRPVHDIETLLIARWRGQFPLPG